MKAAETKSGLVKRFEKRFALAAVDPGPVHLESIVTSFSCIPYENLTKIIRASNETDPVKRLRQPFEVLDDFICLGTGGTCFSLTNCLHALLAEYGYSSAFRMADLGNGRCNHCVLVAYLDERPYLLDPGYLITRPLPIPETGTVVHQTRLRPVLLDRDKLMNGLNLSTMEPEGIRHRYYLHGNDIAEDVFVAYWIDSFSWNMMHSLLITKPVVHGRMYLHDRHVRWYDRHGHTSRKLIENFDDGVKEYTGINREIICRAREILAVTKRSLQEKTVQNGNTCTARPR